MGTAHPLEFWEDALDSSFPSDLDRDQLIVMAVFLYRYRKGVSTYLYRRAGDVALPVARIFIADHAVDTEPYCCYAALRAELLGPMRRVISAASLVRRIKKDAILDCADPDPEEIAARHQLEERRRTNRHIRPPALRDDRDGINWIPK